MMKVTFLPEYWLGYHLWHPVFTINIFGLRIYVYVKAPVAFERK